MDILQGVYSFFKTVRIFLLLLVSLVQEIHGTEIQVHGLNIEQILSANGISQNPEIPKGQKHLDVMLKNYPFSASVIDEQVAVTLTEQSTQLSDTDESIEVENQAILGIIPQKFASKFSVDQSGILLKPSEIDHNQDPTQITKNLCRKLAKDAFRIANVHKSARTREATTCLCVVLRDEEKRPKKFVFHNSTGEMQASMRKKADDLAYGIRNAHLSHAEVQLIDFLVSRAYQREREEDKESAAEQASKIKKSKYTHILGMGCSRKHCQECNSVCKLFFGNSYFKFTAAMEKLNDQSSIPVIEELAQEHEADLKMTIPAAVQNLEAVFQEDAIRSGSHKSTNYRLLETMKTTINNKSGLTLNLTYSRFNAIGKKVIQQPIENSKEVALPMKKKGKVSPF